MTWWVFLGWEADLHDLSCLGLHFPPCLPPQQGASSVSPACICYGHIKQKLKLLFHVGAHHLLILPQEKEVPSASSWDSFLSNKFQFSAQQRHWRDDEIWVKALCVDSVFCKSVSGLIGGFLAWAQHCTNMALGNMGINPRSFVYLGTYLNIKAFSVLLLLCIHLRSSKQLKITKSSLCKLKKCSKKTKTNTEVSSMLIRNVNHYNIKWKSVVTDTPSI